MRLGRCLLVGACLALQACVAVAQSIASRPIEIIVPWGAGGGSDQVARKIAKLLEPRLQTSVQVTNLPGSSGQKGLARMLAADADGHTLCVMTADTLGLLATRQTGWHLSDIVPIGVLMQQPSALLVHEQSRFKTWADLANAAKSESVRVAIAGVGTPDELTIMHLSRAGLRLVGVPIPRPGERQLAILRGSVDALYEQVGDVRSLVENKQLRPLLLLDDRRDPRFKDTPTSHELGYDIALAQYRVLVAKTGADQGILRKLGEALADVAADAEYAAHLGEQYARADSFLPAEQATDYIKRELERLRLLVAEQNAMVGR
jgi:tripartite-type tricarboxylate transporter receptor subunit TctC